MLVITGNAMTNRGPCERILFLNSSWELEASVIPDENGNFIFQANDDSYTVIFIGPMKLETKVYYNVKPINIK